MKTTIFTLLLFISFSSFAQTEIRINEIKNHIGDSVKICAIVRGVKYLPNAKNKPTFLDYGDYLPDAPLTLIIWGNTRSKFEKSLDWYNGAYVCLTGKITLSKGKPQIVLYSKQQVISAVKDEEVEIKK